MIVIADIKSYWRESELSAITDYNGDSDIDDSVIQLSIDDATAETTPLVEVVDGATMDLYIKRMTICNLLVRLNINPEAVILPLNDCDVVRKLLSKILDKKMSIALQDDTFEISTSIAISKNESSLKEDLIKY